MSVVATTSCTACRKPTDPASMRVIKVGSRVVARVCEGCEPKVRRGFQAASSVALRGIGLAAEHYAPKTFALLKMTYLTARDAWDKAEGES